MPHLLKLMDNPKRIVGELGLISLAVLVRWGIDQAVRGGAEISWWETMVLLAAGTALVQAVLYLWASPALESPWELWSGRAWCLLALAGWAGWPFSAHAVAMPVLAWALAAALFLAVHHQMGVWCQSRPAVLAGWRRVCCGLFLAWSLMASTAFLYTRRPEAGSVDLFYYLCTARDMIRDPQSTPIQAYGYFPGVYAFWRSVLQVTGEDPARIQGAIVALLVANAMLLCAVVRRGPGGWGWGVLASLWYLASATRYDGLAGVTEPLATLPFLLALLLWGGRPWRWPGAILKAVAMGALLGLAVYCKQQAGLLCLGALALAGSWLAEGRRWRDAMVLLLVPAAALGALAAGIAAEGKGWVPLQRGLWKVQAYAPQGSWLGNLYVQARADESLAAAGLVLVVATAWHWYQVLRQRPGTVPSWLAITTWLAVSALASLLQFRLRPYGHYMLLGLPCVVGGVVLWLEHVAWPAVRDRHLVAGLLMSLLALPLLGTHAYHHTLTVWPIRQPPRTPTSIPWFRQPQVQQDMERLRRYIRRGDTILVLPPRYNAVYFLLGVRTARQDGYSFHMPDLQALPWEELSAVVLVTGSVDREDRPVWNGRAVQGIREMLGRRGFRKQEAALGGMELWIRASEQSRSPPQ